MYGQINFPGGYPLYKYGVVGEQGLLLNYW